MEHLIALLFVIAPQVSADASAWIREHAIAITRDPESVAAIGERIGKPRVVCFGDASFGEARELAALQRALLEHAVSSQDVRVLAIDANATESALLDEYVVAGKGDLVAIVKSLRDPRFMTREFLDTIAWLRAFNSKPSHAHKVRIAGIDVQYTQLAAQEVGDYVQKVDYEAAPRITSILSPLRQVDPQGRPRFASASPELRYVTMSYLPELLAMIEDNREAHVKASSEPEWQRAKRNVEFLIQAEEVMRAAIDGTDPTAHARVLGDNVARAVELAGEGGRVHVWTDLARASGAFGAQLRERFSDGVRIGLAFAESPELKSRGQLSPSDVASLETLQPDAKPVRAWIDLREAPENVLRDVREKLDALFWYDPVSAAAR